jgi:hypothetical protein
MTDEQRYEVIEAVTRDAYGEPVSAHERQAVGLVYDLIADRIRREAQSELLEFVESALVQACYTEDGLLDSMALSTWAEGLRLLAEHGRVEIIEEHGRRVIARIIPETPDVTDN